MFSFEFCKISMNTFSYRTPRVAAPLNPWNNKKIDPDEIIICCKNLVWQNNQPEQFQNQQQINKLKKKKQVNFGGHFFHKAI